MAKLREDLEWKARWEERGQVVRGILGDTFPSGSVTPFAWRDYILPGACALTFRTTSSSRSFLYMTLGLTQPLRVTDPSYPWEFSVRTRDQAEWPVDLLYQLVTQWFCEEGNIGFGYHLPLVFFTDRAGKLWAGISNDIADLNVVGSLRGLYLWTDADRIRFPVPSGDFGFLTVVGVTEDEDGLAREATPAHLMLLLRQMGVDQVCDPHRRSVLSMPGASQAWDSIKTLSHDAALEELQEEKGSGADNAEA